MMKKRRILFAVLLIAGAAFSGCLKQAFDNPPDTSGYDPQLPVTATIAQLKAMNGAYQYQTGGDTSVITTDVTIAGIVTADDRSGNFYKAINIEDSTGGIQLAIDAYSLYASYPVGRKIYVKCRGLMLGYSGGTPVLGMGLDEQLNVQGITGRQVDAHIIKADVGHAVTPLRVALSQLAAANPDRSLLDRLVTIDDAEFVDSLGNKTYAQPNGTTNRDVKDCSSRQISVRTSNYADFFNIPLPPGKGAITGVFSIYVSPTTARISPQLTIRDTGDVKFYGPRCGGGNGGSSVPLITIDSIRNLYKGKNLLLGAYRIHGTVITDAAGKNVSTGSFIMQSGTKGINIYMGGIVPYAVGDSLVITVTGDSLKTYANMLEIDGVATGDVVKMAANVPVNTRVVSLATLTAGFDNYVATLVKVVNASVSGGTYYKDNSGNLTLQDGTGSMILRTATTAVFAGQLVPAGAKSFTGVAGYFNTIKQLSMRNISDVQ